MIIELTEYNPLAAILMFTKLSDPDVETLEAISQELFRAGVIPESGDEFKQVLDLLIEVEKEYYGER